MILADAVASGADPDAISMWCKILSWLTASRTDSAVWAIAFTINTWAASIKSARILVYKNVHDIFVTYKNEINDAQWLERAQSLTDADGHKKFRSRVNKLLEYIDKKDADFRTDAHNNEVLIKRIMWAAATLSVLVIVFEWYNNFLLILLFPYPLFCFWQTLRGWRAKLHVKWLRWRASRALAEIERSCRTPADEPPSMDELKKKL